MTISISFTAALKIANSFFNQSERQKFIFLYIGHQFFQIGQEMFYDKMEFSKLTLDISERSESEMCLKLLILDDIGQGSSHTQVNSLHGIDLWIKEVQIVLVHVH